MKWKNKMFSYNMSHKNISALINKIEMKNVVIDWDTNESDYKFSTVVAIKVNQYDISVMLAGKIGWMRVGKNERVFMGKM